MNDCFTVNNKNSQCFSVSPKNDSCFSTDKDNDNPPSYHPVNMEEFGVMFIYLVHCMSDDSVIMLVDYSDDPDTIPTELYVVRAEVDTYFSNGVVKSFKSTDFWDIMKASDIDASISDTRQIATLRTSGMSMDPNFIVANDSGILNISSVTLNKRFYQDSTGMSNAGFPCIVPILTDENDETFTTVAPNFEASGNTDPYLFCYTTDYTSHKANADTATSGTYIYGQEVCETVFFEKNGEVVKGGYFQYDDGCTPGDTNNGEGYNRYIFDTEQPPTRYRLWAVYDHGDRTSVVASDGNNFVAYFSCVKRDSTRIDSSENEPEKTQKFEIGGVAYRDHVKAVYLEDNNYAHPIFDGNYFYWFNASNRPDMVLEVYDVGSGELVASHSIHNGQYYYDDQRECSAKDGVIYKAYRSVLMCFKATGPTPDWDVLYDQATQP